MKALGRYVPIRCDVEVFEGMSVHGEADASEALAARLHDELGWLVVPDDGEIVRVP